MNLEKYVAVLPDGTWLSMGTLAEMQSACERNQDMFPGLHVERWTYREKADGSHAYPRKELVS